MRINCNRYVPWGQMGKSICAMGSDGEIRREELILGMVTRWRKPT